LESARAAGEIFRAIHESLACDERAREPMNALVIWTELGKGLAGTLVRKGASPSLLVEVISGYCKGTGAAPVDLARWAYRVPHDRRLSREEIGTAIRRVLARVEERLPSLAATPDAEGERAAFLAIVRGWFPVGLDVVAALPGAAGANRRELAAALCAWCERYLPTETATGLGVGVVREAT
jgi:hypothetical protein